jgi:hypothetical protein
MRERTTHTPSYAGLTRVSIHLRHNSFAKKMDCRVKPGKDGKSVAAFARTTASFRAAQAVIPRKNP